MKRDSEAAASFAATLEQHGAKLVFWKERPSEGKVDMRIHAANGDRIPVTLDTSLDETAEYDRALGELFSHAAPL